MVHQTTCKKDLPLRRSLLLHIRVSFEVTKETMTVEGMIKIVYDLLKDKLNIVKITFTSEVNGATEEYEPNKNLDRCPLCGVTLNENGVCPKCGYKK